MNQKFIIKFEQGTLEQVYKIAELNVTDGVNGVFQLIDNSFVETVIDRFKQMRTSFKEVYDRHEL